MGSSESKPVAAKSNAALPPTGNNQRSGASGTNVAQISDFDRTMLDLKNSRDKLKRYRKKLDADTVRLQDRARELVSQKQNNRALTLLKLKSFKTKEADKVDAQLFNVLNMIQNVEWESQNIMVLKALKEGTEALNKMHSEMPLETVESILEESNEAIETENSISELLRGKFSAEEEDSLAEEYAALVSAMEAETQSAGATSTSATRAELQLPAPPSIPVLPFAPAGSISTLSRNQSDRLAVET